MRRYPFASYILDIPDDHKIFDIHAVDPFYDRTFTHIYSTIGAHKPSGLIVDIGANVGDTAATILSTCHSNPILCVEGSPEFLPYMRSNLRHLGSRVTLLDRYLRPPATRSISLNAVHERGSGFLTNDTTRGQTVACSSFVEWEEFLHIASQLAPEIALIKTDTDGFDGYIVSELLHQTDFPIFFECDTNLVLPCIENPWPNVFKKLNERGYSILVFDNHGLPMLAAQSDVENILTDLSGYSSLQRSVLPIRVHYLDIWAFPPEWKETFVALKDVLRNDLLRPYRF